MAKTNLLKKSAASVAPKRNLLRKAKLAPNPLDAVEYTGDLCEDVRREFTAAELAFKAQAKERARRMESVLDTEFWVAVCFESRAQKEAFLRAVNIIAEGDKYLDGNKLAKACNIPLERDAPPPRERGIDPKLAELAL